MTNPRDYFTVEERQKLRETVPEYGLIPAYNSLSTQRTRQMESSPRTTIREVEKLSVCFGLRPSELMEDSVLAVSIL